MNRAHQLKSCSICLNRGFNLKHGIICGLTKEVATFSGTCPDYKEDVTEKGLQEQTNKAKVNQKTKEINKARIALFIIGVLYVFVGFLEGFFIAGHDILFGIIDWVIAGVFITLGFWSYKKASLALIIGLGFYIAITLLLMAFEPISIVRGIIWKVLIILALINGIKTAREEEAKIKPASSNLLDDF